MMWHADRPAADVPRMVEQAAEVGIGIYPIAPYFMHPPRRAGFLLGFASMEEDMIHEGIKRLARIFVYPYLVLCTRSVLDLPTSHLSR